MTGAWLSARVPAVAAAQSTALRVHTTSAGLDPARLVPGRDLVLALDHAHGDAAPDGTFVLDHLDPAGRAAADNAVAEAHAAWRAAVGDDGVVAGIDWPFAWMLPAHEVFAAAVTRALALRAALAALSPGSIVLADTARGSARLARSVAESLDLQVTPAAGAAPPIAGGTAPTASAARRVRRAAVDGLARVGAPSRLRSGSVVVHAYWPLEPALDAMLAGRSSRPAVFLDKRPRGLRRTLGAATRGGWIGLPTPLDRRRASADAERIIVAVRAHGTVDVDGLELGRCVHPGLVALARSRAVADLAMASMLRRALRRHRPSRIVGCYDVTPEARILVLVAREAGVPTSILSHGAFLLPQPFPDSDECDEAILWTRTIAPPMRNWNRPVHQVGYPVPHAPPPPTRCPPAERPVIAVLGECPIATSCVLDERSTMQFYVAALGAIGRRCPDARILLRPHPAQDHATTGAAIARFEGLDVHEARGGEITAVLAGADLCIGSASTATLQSALVGTPVVVLNVSGTDWPAPIGGLSAVPVARSAADLERELVRWRSGDAVPGREDLLDALGADGSDPVARLLRVIGPARSTVRRTP